MYRVIGRRGGRGLRLRNGNSAQSGLGNGAMAQAGRRVDPGTGNRITGSTGKGMGFGFRGSSPPAPHIGRGRGGLPRCQYYQNKSNNSLAASKETKNT